MRRDFLKEAINIQRKVTGDGQVRGGGALI